MNVAMLLRNWWQSAIAAAYYMIGNTRAGLLGVRVSSGAKISPFADVKGVYSLGAVVVGRDVVIGEGSYVSSGHLMSGRIGRWCSIGYDVLIGPSEHDPDAVTMSPVKLRTLGLPGNSEKKKAPPVIEDEVWIGARAVVLKGVNIGRGAVVAAGAVVTRDIPAMEIWGGVPARRIRSRQIGESLPTS